MKFRKKPIVVEAFKLLVSTALSDTPNWFACAMKEGKVFYSHTQHGVVIIKTLEGEMTADEGDWIIQGIKGELYPCKRDIFEQTYTPIEGS